MKRILFVNPTAAHGGAEEILLTIMTIAREIGYHPVLVVPRTGWLTEQCEREGIPFELLPSIPDAFIVDDWKEQFRPWLWNGVAIASLARKWRAALVHSNTPRASYHGGLGARLARVAAVTHVHDIVTLPYSSPWKARLLGSFADATVTVSHAVEQAIATLAPHLRSQVRTIHNGLDPARYTAVAPVPLDELFGIPRGAPVIGSVSAMTPWKGQDILIEAFKPLHQAFPQARLLIVGGPQGNQEQERYEARLHRQVHDAGLADVVCFAGWREHVWPLIKSMDIFVHVPTKPDPLPTVVLHACALGSAIIASDTGGIPEMVQNGRGGVLVPPRNAAALAAAAASLLADPPRRRQMGDEAREHFTRHFSRDRMKAALADLYQKLPGQ